MTSPTSAGPICDERSQHDEGDDGAATTRRTMTEMERLTIPLSTPASRHATNPIRGRDRGGLLPRAEPTVPCAARARRRRRCRRGTAGTCTDAVRSSTWTASSRRRPSRRSGPPQQPRPDPALVRGHGLVGRRRGRRRARAVRAAPRSRPRRRCSGPASVSAAGPRCGRVSRRRAVGRPGAVPSGLERYATRFHRGADPRVRSATEIRRASVAP